MRKHGIAIQSIIRTGFLGASAKATLSAPMKRNKLDQLFRAIMTGFSIIHHCLYNKGIGSSNSSARGGMLPYLFLPLPGCLGSLVDSEPGATIAVFSILGLHEEAARLNFPPLGRRASECWKGRATAFRMPRSPSDATQGWPTPAQAIPRTG